MKKLLTILLVGIAGAAFGQTEGKWSVGVGYSPSVQDGSTFAVYINRHMSNKWQIGLTPFVWHNKYPDTQVSTANSTSLGLNINSRFSPAQLKIFKPYIFGRTGYGNTTTKFSSGRENLGENYVNFSLGIGTEVAIKNGWSLDTNLGYMKLDFLNSEYIQNSPIFSVGILKRFGK